MQLESVAKVLIFDENENVLMLRIGEYKDHPEKSHKPDLPGGLVDPGESETQAAFREVLEETGIELAGIQLAYAKTEAHASENKSVSKLLYVARTLSSVAITLSWEHEAYEWQNIDDLIQAEVLRPFYQEAVQYIQDNQIRP